MRKYFKVIVYNLDRNQAEMIIEDAQNITGSNDDVLIVLREQSYGKFRGRG
jgi:hypothetical protein